MVVNELRKDYLLDRWVVIASQRSKRPSDFIEKQKEERKPAVCPFCPGNEHLTPPASLVYLVEDNKLKKSRDENDFRHKNWIIRCVPNLYPAFSPPSSNLTLHYHNSNYIYLEAIGHHEVLIESPHHNEHPSVARITQLINVINALKDRTSSLAGKDYVKYVSIFRNHGASAGASLSHAHIQIIAMPIIPRTVNEEITASRKFYEENGCCIFCKIISKEIKSERFIWDNKDFIVFAPWASVNPFEFWIFPKRHQSSILEITENETRGLAEILRISFGGLRNLLDDPPYNFGFHMATEEHYHWHIEVYPKLAIWAGFEKSTGTYINIMPPEEASKSLRESFEGENVFLREKQYKNFDEKGGEAL
ncbi:MAG: galactose-1-phosphate uridylyltransferase [Candidatus Bathyarchaeia archaeon]